MVLVEFDVHHVVLLHLGHGMGGDQLGVEAPGHVGQVLEHALDIDHHGVHRAGDDRQLLLQEGARRRHAVALQDFVGRAADAAQLDAFGALLLGVFEHLRRLGRGHDHLREDRLVAVDDDVDVIFLQDAEVGFGLQRRWSAEHDVLQVGGQHGAAPPVGQRSPGALLDDVFVVLVHPHVGAVHDIDHLAVDVAGHHPGLFPLLLQRLRGPLQVV